MTAWVQALDPPFPSAGNFEKAAIGFRQNLHDVRRFVHSTDLRETTFYSHAETTDCQRGSAVGGTKSLETKDES